MVFKLVLALLCSFNMNSHSPKTTLLLSLLGPLGLLGPSGLLGLFVGLAAPTQASAQVNLLTGGLEVKPETSDLPFNLKYRSRSLYRGLFGFGWCSDLDYHLEFDRAQSPTLKHCDSVLATQTIEKEPLGWRALLDDQTLHFDSMGRPRMMGPTLLTGSRIFWSEEPKLITRLESAGQVFDFTYRGVHLVNITKNRVPLLAAKYDELHNLTQLKDKAGLLNVTYEDFEDRVKQILYDNGCRDEFQYKMDIRTRTERTETWRHCANRDRLASVLEADYTNQLAPKFHFRSENSRDRTPADASKVLSPAKIFPTLFTEGVQ